MSSPNDFTDLKVGDTVFLAYADRGYGTKHQTVAVAKVGREWATVHSRLRFRLDTGRIDGRGYSSPGRAYPNEAAYEAAVRRNRAWGRLRSVVVDCSAPDSITTEQIEAALAALGIAVGEGEGGTP